MHFEPPVIGSLPFPPLLVLLLVNLSLSMPLLPPMPSPSLPFPMPLPLVDKQPNMKLEDLKLAKGLDLYLYMMHWLDL